ncbi:hypothetical protein BZG36_03958 [Bifiguratus adelaidae]|uniref:Zn-dependent exopeptidase n=1 Tax=Bifiguratus adelaidae TaxID=1938954 RepID=A0A261XZU9_9FUNG|nr:hypothetical protein BZG36_03958 [Bifiguratus adelaidae]
MPLFNRGEAGESGEFRSEPFYQRWWNAIVGEGRIRLAGGDEELDENSQHRRRIIRNVLLGILVVILVAVIAGVVAHFVRKNERHHNRSWVSRREAIDLLLNTPSNDSIREYLYKYTSEAHTAGTEGDKATAEWTKDKFIEFGIEDTIIETYYPLLNYPKYRRVAIVDGPKSLQYEAKLREDVVDEDATSKDNDAVPTFHGYSASGNVTGPVVYVNYGRLEDFQTLSALGVDFNGTIALVRYGGVFRGLKVRAAEQFGCVGVLVYSDPIDDGPIGKGPDAESYPKGPWRSPSSVQRGSVQYLSIRAGDPLTPGFPALKDAKRIKREDSDMVPQIPSLPISWEDAVPLFKAMEGHGLPAALMGPDWTGGLEEILYFSGPSKANVNLVNDVEDKVTPIWNVIGRIEGTVEKDRALVIGNHRDAWVYGAVDPNSGSAAMLDLVRTLGVLLKKGWKPRRTIVIASWDAEEYGLVGSTEWVEDHADWLRKECVAYINVDSAVSGPHFDASASPSLKKLLFDVTARVQDPHKENGTTVYDSWLAQSQGPLPIGDDAKPKVGILGAGSDFVPFLDFIGVTTVDLGFGGDYGVYHSNYDSFHWMEKFGDPDFKYHQALTQIWGLMVLELSSNPILPIEPSQYAHDLVDYTDDLKTLAAPGVQGIEEDVEASEALKFKKLRKAIEGLHDVASQVDTEKSKLRKALSKIWKKRKEHRHRHWHHAPKSARPHDKLDRKTREKARRIFGKVKDMNDRLFQMERGFIDPEGIKGRDWYKHVVYAPGLWAGYGAVTFPTIGEPIEKGDWKEVARAEERVADHIQKASKYLSGDNDDDDEDDESVNLVDIDMLEDVELWTSSV